MRIGLGLEMNGTMDEIVARARLLASTGVSSLWSSQIFGWDTMTVLAIVGREVPEVVLGTAVIPVHPRHPMMLAEQALTVQSACGGRLVLGIGLSHQVVVEGAWGYSFDKPARYMREYLSVLVPLLHGEQVSFNGEAIRTNTFGPLDVAPTPPPPVLVAALGPTMLRQAGAQADGTVTWMVGPVTVAKHIVPAITAAAADAGRPAPQVVVTLPVCVTDDSNGTRARRSYLRHVRPAALVPRHARPRGCGRPRRCRRGGQRGRGHGPDPAHRRRWGHGILGGGVRDPGRGRALAGAPRKPGPGVVALR